MFNKINCFIDVMIEKSQIDDDLISQKVCVEANKWVFFYKFSEQETSISSACLPRHNFQIRNANKQF